MDKFILHVKAHGYDDLSEVVMCFTQEVSNVHIAAITEEVILNAAKNAHFACEELYAIIILMNNNEVVYKHDYQLI